MGSSEEKNGKNSAQGKMRVGVLFGGRSGEHEVSLNSATAVIGALDKSKYEVIPIGITQTGRWITAGDPLRLLKAAVKSGDDGSLTEQVAIPADPSQKALISYDGLTPGKNLKLDVVIPVLHGTFGEDGTVQGLLEIADIPYVGAGVVVGARGV
jgi:D-alanine-D-alanine ligase